MKFYKFDYFPIAIITLVFYKRYKKTEIYHDLLFHCTSVLFHDVPVFTYVLLFAYYSKFTRKETLILIVVPEPQVRTLEKRATRRRFSFTARAKTNYGATTKY